MILPSSFSISYLYIIFILFGVQNICDSRIPPTRETIVPIKFPITPLRHVKDRVKRDIPTA